MASPIETRRFAREQAGRLLGRLAYQANQTVKSVDSARVQDLGVAIRRFKTLLKGFDGCFEGKDTRKLRKRLKRVQDLAHAVGRLDGALHVLAAAPEGAGLRGKVQARRKEAARDLTGALKRWIDRKSSMKWRSALEASLTRKHEVLRGVSMEQVAGAMLPPLAKDFFHAGNEAVAAKSAASTFDEFHAATRKFRYALELFATTPAGNWLEKVRAAHSLLGEIRDWGFAEESIAAHKGSDAVIDWLRKRQRRQQEELRELWRKEFGDPQQVRGWIDSLSPGGKVRAVKKPAGRSLVYRSKSATA